jgi:hypothetical protein
MKIRIVQINIYACAYDNWKYILIIVIIDTVDFDFYRL